MNNEHNIISVPGGKDSTALLLLAMERQPDNMQAVFAVLAVLVICVFVAFRVLS